MAMALHNRSYQLTMLERFDEAIPQADEAVTIYRRLAADHLDTFAPDLAEALYDYAVALDGAQRRREALAAVTEAVDIC